MAQRPDIDGPFSIRPIRASDKRALSEGLGRLSDEAVYRRFMSPKPRFSGAELRYLTELDGWNHLALVATPADDPDSFVAVARFVRMPEDPATAEFAIVVGDPYQGRGLGKRLALALADAARERGIERFTASTLGDNVPAQRLMASIAERMHGGRASHGVRELELELAA